MSWEADNLDNARLDNIFTVAKHFIETGEIKSPKSIWQSMDANYDTFVTRW
jgi:hypothetical protein